MQAPKGATGAPFVDTRAAESHHVQASCSKFHHLTRRFRRWPRPRHHQPTRRGRHLASWMGHLHRTFQRNLFGSDGGAAGIDDDFAARGFQNIGAWILGRNMFGPVRGPWPDESWRGWWGENPVYHVPVFVLTNHARAPLVMEGGTTFHFVTEGIAAALAQAREAAEGKDVRLGGGVNVIQQYLRQRLIDEMHIAIRRSCWAPVKDSLKE